MWSSKRLLGILSAVVLLGCAIMAFSAYAGQASSKQGDAEALRESEFTEAASLDKGDVPGIWVLGDVEDAQSGRIYENVCRFFDDIHVPTHQGRRMSLDAAAPGDLVVLCDRSLARCVPLSQLEGFVARGGKVIAAAGLDEGGEDSEIWPAFGIEGKSSRFDCETLSFEGPLLPLQPERTACGPRSDSVGLLLDDDASVLVSDADGGTPIVYAHPWKQGRTCLINGAFLADMANMGFLAGSLGALLSDFIYPVLGVKAVFLDDFPLAPAADDELYRSLYGSSVRGFVRDEVWPVLQGVCVRTNTPYTSSMLVESSSADAFGALDGELVEDIGSLVLRFDGELAYGSDCEEGDAVVLDEALIGLFKESFPDYPVQGLALEADSLAPKMLDVPGADIWAVRGTLGSSDLSFSWEDGLLVFPAATRGNSMEDGNLVSLCSTLGAYGMVSHVFDIGSLGERCGDVPAWDAAAKQIGLFESEVLARAPWLEERTLTQTRDDVRSYLSMDYAWSREGNRVELACSGIKRGQAFIYRTDDAIVGAENLSYELIGDGYYLLRVQENAASITLEEGDRP